ncbi:hypothetical protein EV122DRAFT_286252 [Schizophyllum commune]
MSGLGFISRHHRGDIQVPPSPQEHESHSQYAPSFDSCCSAELMPALVMKFTPVLAASLAAVPAFCAPDGPYDPDIHGSSSSSGYAGYGSIPQHAGEDLVGAADTILEVANGLVNDSDSDHTPELEPSSPVDRSTTSRTSHTDSAHPSYDSSCDSDTGSTKSKPIIIKDTDAARTTPVPRKNSLFSQDVPIIVISAEQDDGLGCLNRPAGYPCYPSPAHLKPPRVSEGGTWVKEFTSIA